MRVYRRGGCATINVRRRRAPTLVTSITTGGEEVPFQEANAKRIIDPLAVGKRVSFKVAIVNVPDRNTGKVTTETFYVDRPPFGK